MSTPTDIHVNRTGIAGAPVQGPKAVAGAREGTVAEASLGDGVTLARARERSLAASAPLGSVPPLGTVQDPADAVLAAPGGERASVLVDKLGERLAFERTAARLYEAALAKARDAAAEGQEPTAAQLAEICEEEQRHFDLLRSAMERLGADPTAQTPSADVAGVAGWGLVQVATDARTTLTETLEALLVAELADTEGWTLLVDLMRGSGHGELASRLADARRTESIHLERVRGWLWQRILCRAGVDPAS